MLPSLLLSLSTVSCCLCVSVSVIITNTTSPLSSPSTTHLHHHTPLPYNHTGCPKYLSVYLLPSPPMHCISITRRLRCPQYCPWLCVHFNRAGHCCRFCPSPLWSIRQDTITDHRNPVYWYILVEICLLYLHYPMYIPTAVVVFPHLQRSPYTPVLAISTPLTNFFLRCPLSLMFLSSLVIMNIYHLYPHWPKYPLPNFNCTTSPSTIIIVIFSLFWVFDTANPRCLLSSSCALCLILP